MSWLRNHYSKQVSRIYAGGLYDHPDKLDTFWPLLAGGCLFFLIDYWMQLEGFLRWVILMLLLGPGMVWAAFLLFHEVKSLPGRYRRHQNVSERSE